MVGDATPGPPPQPLTAAWLAAHSAELAGASAAEEAPLAVGETEGANSVVTQLRVKLASEEHSEYFVKRITLGTALQAALFQRWYEREYRFYTEVCSAASGSSDPGTVAAVAVGDDSVDVESGQALQAPRCVSAVWSKIGDIPGAPSFLLVLKSLGPPRWTRPDPAVGCSLQEALGAVEALGHLHARFYGPRGAQLETLQWLPVTPLHVEFASICQGYFEAIWHGSRAWFVEALPPAVASMCDALCESYPLLVRQLAEPPLTLLHGDFRLENLRFAMSATDAGNALPTVAAFDWQFVCRGRGAYDFAYFLALSLPPDMRRRHEEELKRRYLAVLARVSNEKAAILEASFDADVRAALLLTIASSVLGTASAPPEALARHKRALCWLGAAATDWDVGRALPAL